MTAAEIKARRLETDLIGSARPSSLTTFRQMTANVFDLIIESDDADTFDGYFTAHASKQFVLTEASYPRVRLKRTPAGIALSQLDHFVIRLLISGSATGLAGHQTLEASDGDVLFVDLSQTLDLQLTPERGNPALSDISLWIPRACVLAAFREENALHGLAIKGTSPAGAMIGANFQAFSKQADSLTNAEMDALGNGVLELIARVIAPTLERTGLSSAPSQLASFVTIRRYIDRNLTSVDLDADTIAKRFGLSRASLYRLFDPVGGIASYIRKARLKRAYQEVTSFEFSDRRIGQIAFSLGFRTVGAFNRQFHKAYGLSPREARRQLTKAASPKIPGPVTSAETPFATLLAQIGLP
jgi:AraC-like DNA-binding protein